MVVLITLAFALRAFRLDYQSLWGDEIASVFMSGRATADIIQGAIIDIHPPLYYYLLHFWMGLAGDSGFSVRFLSLAVGVLTVAMTFAVGRKVLPWPAALLGALFLAASPFHVQYSQETRMYALATALAALSAYCFLRLLSGSRCVGTSRQELLPSSSLIDGQLGMTQKREARGIHHSSFIIHHSWWWATYVLASVLLLYAHYAGAAVLLAQSLGVLLSARRRERRFLAAWAGAQMAIALLFLPWLIVALRQLGGHAGYDALPAAEYVARTAAAFTVGLAGDPGPWLPAAGALWLMAGLGAAASWRRSQSDGAKLLAPWLVLPPLCLILISLLVKPFFEPRFLLPALPAFTLLLAAGAGVGCRVSGARGQEPGTRNQRPGTACGVATALVVLILAGRGLSHNYFDARYARDDWRGLARQIEMLAQPSDGIVLNAPGLTETLSYYYRGKRPYYGFPRPNASPEETESALKNLTSEHERIWLILWGERRLDPTHVVETWLDRNAHRIIEQWVGNLRVALYANALAAPETLSGATFGGSLQLTSYALEPRELPADGAFRVSLRWRALSEPGDRLAISLKLVDQLGRTWGNSDSEPAGDSEPTPGWPAGREVLDRRAVSPFLGAPPGEYKLVASVYSRATQQVSPAEGPLSDGKSVHLGDVRLLAAAQPAPAEALPIEHRLNLASGSARLLGYNLEPGKGPLKPGDRLSVTLFWQAAEKPDFDAEIRLELVGRDEESVAQQQARPILPAPLWKAGQTLRDPHELTVGTRALTGEYRLRLAVKDAVTGAVLPLGSQPSVTLDAFSIYAPRQFDTPRMAKALSANFGDKIDLLGYDLSIRRGGQETSGKDLRPGDEVHLTLYWRARATMDENYTVFAHALAGGRIIGQRDGWPGKPERPTSSFVKGEIVTDERVFLIASDAPPGDAELEVGLYLLPGGDRLPVLDAKGQTAGNRVVLQGP